MYVQFTNALLTASQVLCDRYPFCIGYMNIIVELLVLQVYCRDSDNISSYSWLIKNFYQ